MPAPNQRCENDERNDERNENEEVPSDDYMRYYRYLVVLGYKGYDWITTDIMTFGDTIRYDSDPTTNKNNRSTEHEHEHEHETDEHEPTTDDDGSASGSAGASAMQSMSNVWTNIWVLLGTDATCIIPSVYVGSSFDASNRNALHKHNITHVVNVTNHLPHFFEEELVYLRIALGDTVVDHLCMHEFDRAICFMNAAVRSGGRVLVHCMMGRSRSVALICYYMYVFHKMSIHAAYQLVRQRRECVNINMNFYNKLQKYTAPV